MKKSVVKKLLSGAAALLTVAMLTLHACAADAVIDTAVPGLEEAFDKLDDGTKRLLEQSGIGENGLDGLFSPSLDGIVSMITDVIKSGAANQAAGLAAAFAAVVFSAAAGSFLPEKQKAPVLGAACGCFLLLAIFPHIYPAVKAGISFVGAAADFELALIPAFAAAVTAAGEPRLALSYASLSLAACELLQLAAKKVVLPLCGAVLALGAAESFSPEVGSSSAASSLGKAVRSALGAAAAVFSGLLGIKGVVSKNVDSLAAKGIKTAAGFVPVIGGALGEAYSSVRGSLTLISSAVGSFGIAALFSMALPVTLELFLWCAVLKAGETAAEFAGDGALAGLMRAISGAVSMVNVLVILSAAVFIISCGIVLSLSSG